MCLFRVDEAEETGEAASQLEDSGKQVEDSVKARDGEGQAGHCGSDDIEDNGGKSIFDLEDDGNSADKHPQISNPEQDNEGRF